MVGRLYFTYKGELIHRADGIGSSLRYWCLFSGGGILRADTQAGMKILINDRRNVLKNRKQFN